MKVSPRLWIPLLLLPVAAFFVYSFATSGQPEPGEETGVMPSSEPFAPADRFDQYWYQGQAELTSFDLEQARYGEIHTGKAVTIFVTEDFSLKDLTKSDGKSGKKVPVIKVNFDKKFNTGLYPYSMMMTVVSPVDIGTYPNAIKVAMGSQEWCGHTYTQLNLRGNKYEMTEHSYFPGEGDQEEMLDVVLTEDELWTRIRISPEHLPTGEMAILPSTFYMRLKHQKIAPKKAKLSLNKSGDSTGETIYEIKYLDGSRKLAIRFETEFPHKIMGWEESYESGWGDGAKMLTTKATRVNTLKLDYWNKNKIADTPLRKELGVEH